MTHRTTLTAVDPRSAAKIGVAVGVCLFVAWMIAATLVYILLGAAGVWDRVNSLVGDLFAADGVSAGMYFGLAGAVGFVEVVVTALFLPLGAVLYNCVAGYVGGIEVTVEMPDRDAEDTGRTAAEETPQAPAAPGTTVEAPLTGPSATGWGLRSSAPGTTGAHRAE